MDLFMILIVNARYPLPLHKCFQKVVLNFNGPQYPHKCVELPIKLAHDVAYEPVLLSLNQKGVIIAPSSRKPIF